MSVHATIQRAESPPRGDRKPLLQVIKGSKIYGGVHAIEDVDFDLYPGEVHALVGENGAGKSTLCKAIAGAITLTSGDCLIDGKPVKFEQPRDALSAGICMVYQETSLVPTMTAAQNIELGNERLLTRFRTLNIQAQQLLQSLNFHVDPATPVALLGAAKKQMVEIARAVYNNARIIIFDEPTATLTPEEIVHFFHLVRDLRARGVAIIYISHALEESLQIADRITVLRRGKTIETVEREGATEQSLARAMVGREVLLRVEKQPAQAGDVLLEVEDLWASDDRGIEKVRGVSFQVHAGEIVGIAGVDGNGQTELIEALTGLRRADRGVIRVGGRELHHASTRDVLDAGLGHIPEDRQRRGLVLEFSLAENIALHDYAEPPDSKWGWLFPGRLVERASRLIKEFDVRGGGPLTRAGALSGGNQQKVVAAREIARDPKALIAAQPTRGLDVGAIEYLHRRLVTERDEGRAILLVSLELDEIFSLSDRILVLYEGEIVGHHEGEVSEEQIGFEMVGLRQEVTA